MMRSITATAVLRPVTHLSMALLAPLLATWSGASLASTFFGNPGFKVDPDVSGITDLVSSELEFGDVITYPCGAGSNDTITTGATVYDSVASLGTVANGDWCELSADTETVLDVRVEHDGDEVKFALDLGTIEEDIPAWPTGSQELHLDLNIGSWLDGALLDDVTPNGLVIDSSHADYNDVLTEAKAAIELVAIQ